MAYSIKYVLDLLFPPLCRHCHIGLQTAKLLFCPTCLEQVTLIETQGRCWTCFAELHKGRCERCIHRPVVIRKQIAACEAMGPMRTLLKGIQSGKREFIPAAASLMAYQWLEQKMPLPDLLIPFPLSFWQKQKLGFDANLLLAQEIAKTFSVRVHSLLKRKFDLRQFLATGEPSFRYSLSKTRSICDLRVLLIAPFLDDAALRRAGSELRTHFPAQVEVLAFTTEL